MKCTDCGKTMNDIYRLIYTCKCKSVYCRRHIFTHPCSYDHFFHEQNRLEKNLVKVAGTKVDKI